MRSTGGRAQAEMISHVAATRRPLWILLAASRPGNKFEKKSTDPREGPIQRSSSESDSLPLFVVFGVELSSALFVIYAIIMHWVNSHSRPLFHPLLVWFFVYSYFFLPLFGFCGFLALSAKPSIQFCSGYCRCNGYIWGILIWGLKSGICTVIGYLGN